MTQKISRARRAALSRGTVRRWPLNPQDRRGADSNFHLRLARLRAALTVSRMSRMSEERRQQVVAELTRIVDEMDAEIAADTEKFVDIKQTLAHNTAVREDAFQLLEKIRMDPEWEQIVTGKPARIALVEAIDQIILSSKGGIDRKALAVRLEVMAAQGSIVKVPTDASLRAMLSQYANPRGWRREIGKDGVLMYYPPPAAEPEVSGESEVPF